MIIKVDKESIRTLIPDKNKENKEFDYDNYFHGTLQDMLGDYFAGYDVEETETERYIIFKLRWNDE